MRRLSYPDKSPTVLVLSSVEGICLGGAPDWGVLAEVDRSVLIEFMYMGYYNTTDGIAVHAYKHIITRRYVYASRGGHVWSYHKRLPVDSEQAGLAHGDYSGFFVRKSFTGLNKIRHVNGRWTKRNNINGASRRTNGSGKDDD